MRSDRAQAAVEFALAIPVLLIVAIGTFDVARAAWQANTLSFAVREGARYAIAHGAASEDPVGPPPGDDEAVRATVMRMAIGVRAPTVTVSWPDGDNRTGSRVTVEAVASFAPALSEPFGGGPLRLLLRGVTTQVIR